MSTTLDIRNSHDQLKELLQIIKENLADTGSTTPQFILVVKVLPNNELKIDLFASTTFDCHKVTIRSSLSYSTITTAFGSDRFRLDSFEPFPSPKDFTIYYTVTYFK